MNRGYFQLQRARLGKDANAVDWGADLNAVAAGVERLMELGYPPLWIMVYDEVWSLAHQLSEIISATTNGRNVNNFDVLAWHVDPTKNQKGFSPHRDRMPATPDLVKASFHDDGTPKYISTWFPLTDATTSNSCLYMLPAEYDPGYATGDDPESNPLHVAMEKDPTAYQHIRALPSSSGSPLLFSHRIIHWGAATDPSPDSLDAEGNQKVTSRIAIGFAFSSNDYEPPYLDPDTHLPFPAIELRVALAAAQGITYYKRLGFNRHQLALFNRIFVSKQSEFGERYVKKIRGEYQWAQFAMKRQG
jgi:hypothetical protein